MFEASGQLTCGGPPPRSDVTVHSKGLSQTLRFADIESKGVADAGKDDITYVCILKDLRRDWPRVSLIALARSMNSNPSLI